MSCTFPLVAKTIAILTILPKNRFSTGNKGGKHQKNDKFTEINKICTTEVGF
jgi:hypothetical protein